MTEWKFPAFTARQIEGLRAARTHKYTLIGGAAGGGKSYFLRWWCVRYLEGCFTVLGLRGVVVGLFSEDYPQLHERHIRKIEVEFPSHLGSWNAQKKEFQLTAALGGGIIACRNLDDPSKYVSSEFAAIVIDELTRSPRDTFDALIHRMRWPGLDAVRFVAATNPGGVGHYWVKKLWVDRDFRDEPPGLDPAEFAYIPAKATDNPHLSKDYYEKTLGSLPEAMRKALQDGSWDITEGQYFIEFDRQTHVVEPWPVQNGITDQWGIPLDWQRVGGIDWGRAAPWSCMEAAIDPDGRVIVYRGVAEPGWEHERQANFIKAGSSKTSWFADRACWAKGAANSKEARALDISHAELWSKYGASNITPAIGGDRVAGWQHVASFLRKGPDGRPGILFFNVPGLKGDHGIITTLPTVVRDRNKLEDVDSDCDDHAVDSLRYMLTARPVPKYREKEEVDSRKDYFWNRDELLRKHRETLGYSDKVTVGGY